MNVVLLKYNENTGFIRLGFSTDLPDDIADQLYKRMLSHYKNIANYYSIGCFHEFISAMFLDPDAIGAELIDSGDGRFTIFHYGDVRYLFVVDCARATLECYVVYSIVAVPANTCTAEIDSLKTYVREQYPDALDIITIPGTKYFGSKLFEQVLSPISLSKGLSLC